MTLSWCRFSCSVLALTKRSCSLVWWRLPGDVVTSSSLPWRRNDDVIRAVGGASLVLVSGFDVVVATCSVNVTWHHTALHYLFIYLFIVVTAVIVVSCNTRYHSLNSTVIIVSAFSNSILRFWDWIRITGVFEYSKIFVTKALIRSASVHIQNCHFNVTL